MYLLCSIQSVADGFMQLVNDDSRDCPVLSVSPMGLAYVKTAYTMEPVDPVTSSQ